MSKKGVKDLSHLTCPYEGETLDEAMDISDIEGVITDGSVKDFQNHVIPEWYASGMMNTIKRFDSTPTTINDDATRQMMLHAIVDQVFDKNHHRKHYDVRGENGEYVLSAHISHRVFNTPNDRKVHFPKEYYIDDTNSPIIYARDIFEEKNGKHFMIGTVPVCHMTSVQYGYISVTIPEDIFDPEVLKKYDITRQIFIEIQGPLSDKNILAIYNKVISVHAYAVLNIDFEKLITNHPDIKWSYRPYRGTDGDKLIYTGLPKNDGNGVISICGQMGSLNK